MNTPDNMSEKGKNFFGFKRFFRAIIIGLIVLIFLSAVFIGWSFYAAIYKWRSPVGTTVEIEPGSPVVAIAEKLAQNQVIKTPGVFTAYVKLRGMSSKLKAGEYEFPAGMTAAQVVEKLYRGDVKKYYLQIIEGWTIKDIIKYLSDHPVVKDPAILSDFERLVKDKAYIESLGFTDIATLEGYLFPDTYEVVKPKDAQEIIKIMTNRFKEIYSPEWDALAKNANLTQKDVITLASIVEKETGKADERPIIASVFLNRLKQNMPLQSDPTVIYGIPDFDGNLRKSDLENMNNPYNTYVRLGLPPGPISNPGKASIEAVLRPMATDYLYFVSKNDGSHAFASTLEEHNRNVSQYQLGIPLPAEMAETMPSQAPSQITTVPPVPTQAPPAGGIQKPSEETAVPKVLPAPAMPPAETMAAPGVPPQASPPSPQPLPTPSPEAKPFTPPQISTTPSGAPVLSPTPSPAPMPAPPAAVPPTQPPSPAPVPSQITMPPLKSTMPSTVSPPPAPTTPSAPTPSTPPPTSASTPPSAPAPSTSPATPAPTAPTTPLIPQSQPPSSNVRPPG